MSQSNSDWRRWYAAPEIEREQRQRVAEERYRRQAASQARLQTTLRARRKAQPQQALSPAPTRIDARPPTLALLASASPRRRTGRRRPR